MFIKVLFIVGISAFAIWLICGMVKDVKKIVKSKKKKDNPECPESSEDKKD